MGMDIHASVPRVYLNVADRNQHTQLLIISKTIGGILLRNLSTPGIYVDVWKPPRTWHLSPLIFTVRANSDMIYIAVTATVIWINTEKDVER